MNSSEELKQAFDGTIQVALKKILGKVKRGQALTASETKFLKEMREAIEPNQEEKNWDVEYRKYKALLAEIQYEEQKGLLIPREKVTSAWRNRYAHIKRHLMLWSKRLPGRLVGLSEREMIGVIDEEVNYLLSRLARPGKFTELGEEYDTGCQQTSS